ncbi:MAG: M28 family peptidase [Phycisphaerae bacterium]|nr:M28 family peptidase [Phycisphaerae bacterium]
MAGTEPNQQHDTRVQRWLGHIRVLAEEIGPRGSTTQAERQGAEYCQTVLNNLGYDARLEEFSSARSIYHPHVLASLCMLAAFALYPWAGRWTAGLACLISAVAIICELLELSFRDNLFRRLIPKGPSQNVVAVAEPRGERRRDLVLIGHVDSHRSPIIFSSQAWLKFYGVFIAAAFVLFLAQIVLFGLGAATQWSWIWPATIPSAVCAAVLLAICVQADATPFSPGANDNATAAGLIVTLGEHMRTEPLRHTRVWLVCSGCEEVAHYGAIDFFRRHRGELSNPTAVVFESLGCDGPAWLTKEGIVVPFHADRTLVATAERLAEQRPDLGAYPTKLMGGNTEMADALRAGVPAITICGITRDGRLPYWHQPGDTVDKMNPEVLARAYAFTWAYLQAIDTGD